MKEFICYFISIIVVFGLIGMIEGAMLFERSEEDGSSFKRTILEK